jgi:manganese/zinc-transporting P-type ATPase C
LLNKKKDESIQVQHALPGRIRYRLPLLQHRADIQEPLVRMLSATDGVAWARANPKCASLVVRFNPNSLNREELSRSLTEFLQRHSGPDRSPTDSMPVRQTENRHLNMHSAKRRFAGLSVLAAGVFTRTAVLRLPLAQTLFSPLGAVTVLAALPLIRAGLSDLRNRRVSLESFLGGGILAAAAAGEAVAALEILWITSAGKLLQAWITERSRRAIRDILEITEKETYIISDGVEISIPVDQVRPGDTVVLHTGEKIAVDGEIIRGEALIDDSPITGRAEPAVRSRADQVLAGTFVRQGVIFVKAQQVGDRTYLSRILQMVESSLENKAPIEGTADRLARNLIRTGFAVTAATLVLTRNPWRAFSVMLVMACPCATILAASTAISAGISAAARRHILIKGGRYLEEAGRTEVICFDKTGTLTTSKPDLKQLTGFNGVSDDELLELAYSAEIHNSHPVALAIRHEARKRGIQPVSHDVCEYFLGKGVRSVIRGDEILVGGHKLMAQFEVNPEMVKAYHEKVKRQGLTLIFIAKNRTLAGVAGFASRERANGREVIRYLQKDGCRKTVLITGDSKHSALALADRMDFDQCCFSVLPEEKGRIIADLKSNGDRVLMVGDGINDALALAEADIGVAMGAGGSEVAIEAADIALVKDNLAGVVYVRCLSRETIRVVHQNFWIATGSNIAGVVLGGLGMLSPVMAGMVHITHTLGILANSGRLLFYDPAPIGFSGSDTVSDSE